jgi:hypothetical protein
MPNLFDVPHDPANLRAMPVGYYTIGNNVVLRVKYIAVASGRLAKYAAWYHRYRKADGKQTEKNLGSVTKVSLDEAVRFRDSLQPRPKGTAARLHANPGVCFESTSYQSPNGRVWPAWHLKGTQHALSSLGGGYVFYRIDEPGNSQIVHSLTGRPLAEAQVALAKHAAKYPAKPSAGDLV